MTKLQADQMMGGVDGWNSANETWSFYSADSPTFLFSTSSSNVSGIYSPGMKIKLTQSGATKYGIITAVSGSVVTLYMGTDYVLDSGSAITLPNYSMVRTPFGFPMTPSKWAVTVIDNVDRGQLSPTQNVWYNLGTTNTQISIPIGLWCVEYFVEANCSDATASVDVLVTLSTANNSESNTNSTIRIYNTATNILAMTYKKFYLSLGTKTLHYLNAKTSIAGLDSIFFVNGSASMVITASTPYL